MAVVDMLRQNVKNRKKKGNCRMCGSYSHSTETHAAKAVSARLASEVWKKATVASNIKNKTGKPSWNKGIKGSILGKSSDPVIEAERRRKISAHHKGRSQPWCTGKRNWRWKGTKYSKDNAEFRKLRPLVLARDKETCQQCGKTNKDVRIVVHHINHDHYSNWLDNLICLCHPDNVRAEYKKYKRTWETKFRKHTLSLSYREVQLQ